MPIAWTGMHSGSLIFIDTNVLVYAHDQRHAAKHATA